MRGAPLRSLEGPTSQTASRVLVPPMSPASTCMVPGNLPDQARRSRDGRALHGPSCVRAGGTQRFERRGGSMRKILGALLAAALLWPAAGRAQLIETSISPAGDYNWSATAGRTVGNNNSVLQAEAGWPGIGFTYLKGVNELTDIGF